MLFFYWRGFMKSKEVFNSGKIVDTFIHINPNDLYNEYVGYFVEYKNAIYEVITDANNILVSPESDARLITDDIGKLYGMEEYDYEEENQPVIQEMNDMHNNSMYGSLQYKKYQDMFHK